MPVAPCHFSVTISLTWFVPLLLEKQEKFMIKCVIKKKMGRECLHVFIQMQGIFPFKTLLILTTSAPGSQG